MKPLSGLNCGFSIAGSMVTMKQRVDVVVISARKAFLVPNAGSQVKT